MLNKKCRLLDVFFPINFTRNKVRLKYEKSFLYISIKRFYPFYFKSQGVGYGRRLRKGQSEGEP